MRKAGPCRIVNRSEGEGRGSSRMRSPDERAWRRGAAESGVSVRASPEERVHRGLCALSRTPDETTSLRGRWGRESEGQMAPRRGHHTHVEPEVVDPPAATRCCVPTGGCLRGAGDASYVVEPRDAVRVVCNNEQCTAGDLMHRECFEQWEAGVLTYLKSCGRARSWSERQRHQNLWTKKGYDLAFKACGCLCGRGHLKKDLDWAGAGVDDVAGGGGGGAGGGEVNGDSPPPAAAKKKKRRNRHNARPALAPPPPPPQHGGRGEEAARGRAGSMSSSNESSSPPASVEQSISPAHNRRSKSEFFSDRSR
ncbi:hypothetical protein PR048_030885 [Dryococelus australis]|uniref:Headcase N-terminal domain-containing protein n=1 Tax=Dryococelus australis TaxID=614101 RepID=A0ABQ9GE22_9NEOP|nr:hypothetical protein PR048_030885 [Dryococelus australis]